MVGTKSVDMKSLLKSTILSIAFLAVAFNSLAQQQETTMQNKSHVDIFLGVDFNYRDIFYSKLYELLVNLTPGVRWDMGNGWQMAGQIYVPVYNDYGERYKHVRVNIAALSKEMQFGNRWFLKATGGWFSYERYGIDLKTAYIVNNWFALTGQFGVTGHVSMAYKWEASKPSRFTGQLGGNFYLQRWNTEFRLNGGRYVYEDYGVSCDAMRHFKHCTVGLFGTYSDKGGTNAGFKVIVMLPPYKRKMRKVNFRPASNFRFTYSQEADEYANRTYFTDPEENERSWWFDEDEFQWGRNLTQKDFVEKDSKPDKSDKKEHSDETD